MSLKPEPERKLQRRVAYNGVVYYVSPLLEAANVPHAFTTRIGGISAGPYASLNFGHPLDTAEPDTPANLSENARRLRNAIRSLDGRTSHAVRQVHGRDVVQADLQSIDPLNTCGDALITANPRQLLTIRTADCVPVLLASEDGKHVAAVHAGWRGIIANVIAATVETIRRRSTRRLLAAIGPCISFDAFEVGTEVLAEFQRAGFAEDVLRRASGGKGFIDLRECVRRQLQALEVTQVDVSERCTFRDADEFFSHRRDRGNSGRMIAVIGTST